MGRLELPRIAPYASEAYAYTNSATCSSPYFATAKRTPREIILLPKDAQGECSRRKVFHQNDRIQGAAYRCPSFQKPLE
jgi:hypothetical protein